MVVPCTLAAVVAPIVQNEADIPLEDIVDIAEVDSIGHTAVVGTPVEDHIPVLDIPAVGTPEVDSPEVGTVGVDTAEVGILEKGSFELDTAEQDIVDLNTSVLDLVGHLYVV